MTSSVQLCLTKKAGCSDPTWLMRIGQYPASTHI